MKLDMKRVAILLAIAAFLLNLASAGQAVAKAKKGAVKEPKGKAAEPAEKYKSYLVMEANSAKILEEENAHEKRAPASMVKLMVADIVMEKLTRGEIHLTDKITASKAASKIGGSQVYLKEGE